METHKSQIIGTMTEDTNNAEEVRLCEEYIKTFKTPSKSFCYNIRKAKEEAERFYGFEIPNIKTSFLQAAKNLGYATSSKKFLLLKEKETFLKIKKKYNNFHNDNIKSAAYSYECYRCRYTITKGELYALLKGARYCLRCYIEYLQHQIKRLEGYNTEFTLSWMRLFNKDLKEAVEYLNSNLAIRNKFELWELQKEEFIKNYAGEWKK